MRYPLVLVRDDSREPGLKACAMKTPRLTAYSVRILDKKLQTLYDSNRLE